MSVLLDETVVEETTVSQPPAEVKTPAELLERIPVRIPLKAPDLVGIVLSRAADIIETVGWVQGRSADEYGHVCALRAIQIAAVDHGGDDHLIQRAVDKMTNFLGGGSSVPSWNDNICTRREEVTATLRQVARL